MDSHLGVMQKLSLGVHRLMCAPCRLFRKQLMKVDQQVGEFLTEGASPEDDQLSDDARERIKQKLRDESNPG